MTLGPEPQVEAATPTGADPISTAPTGESSSGPYLSDTDFTLHLGDVREVLPTLPAQSAQCCVTSPPYWKLRDYKADAQLGGEPTPEAYVRTLVSVFDELWRVLRDDGTLWLNLGDTYVDKQLVGIPWRVAFALQDAGWLLRCDTIWHKPNPMPSSASDRPTIAHEYLFLFAKHERYYYDADAIKEEALWERWGDQTTGSGSMGWIKPSEKRELVKRRTVREGVDTNGGGQGNGEIRLEEGRGKNKRSVWTIPTESNPDPHYATFPQALVEPCVLAGASENSVILDPFIGSGTTALVARRLGRKCVGIEISEESCQIAARRTQQLSVLA